MKERLLVLTFFLLYCFYVQAQENENESVSDSTKVENKAFSKEEKNRNVMLNAENNTGPRRVNVGLPFTSDVLILENDVPIVYNFYPTIPTTVWRYDNSIGKIGLLSFAEGALTYGKVGFVVNSYDRNATFSFKGYASIYTNNFGSFHYNVAVGGPIGKKGWGYTLGVYESYDRGNGTNYMYTPWKDRTQIYKGSISKKYKKGNIRLLYKYTESLNQIIVGGLYPYVYKGNGNIDPLPGFEPGKDSYIVANGNVPYYDAYTGEANSINLGSDKASGAKTHNIYLSGTHKFSNGWKLNHSTMFQTAKSSFNSEFPLSTNIIDTDQQAGQQFTYLGTNSSYQGPVQLVAHVGMPNGDVQYLASRIEITKKIKNHDLRLGTTYQFNSTDLTAYQSVYAQTIEPNPHLLDYYVYVPALGDYVQTTNQYGALPASAGGYGSIERYKYSKLALYGSDDFTLGKYIDLGIGGRIEHQNINDVHNPYINDFVMDRPLIEKDFKNQWNKVLVESMVFKVSGRFGFLHDLTYNAWNDRYWDYAFKDANGNPMPDPTTPEAKPMGTIAKELKTRVLNVGGGIYYNYGDIFSVVSKVTFINKSNVKSYITVTDPADANERKTVDPLFYDISTLGWSTDIVTKPFKGFSLHYLITLQNPQYKNYNYNAFGTNYSYSNNIIPQLSKTLMEIDPSYSFNKGTMRLWVSLRYFGKQYGNLTNSIYYKGWWENFGGFEYRPNRKVEFKLQVVNFLNQIGVKGAINGADQLTDSSQLLGRKIVAGVIRPRTFELTVNFKF